MRYVDAGYAVSLTVLFVYAVSLVRRRRRLERAVLVAEQDGDTVRTAGDPPAAGR